MSKRRIFAGGEFLITDSEPGDVFIVEEMTMEHKMIYSAAIDFVKKEILPNGEQFEKINEGYTRSLLEMAGNLGLNGTDIPEAYGGEDMDKTGTCLVTEALGGAPSFTVSHGAHTGIGTLPIVYFGSDEQKRKYLPKLATGEWFAAYCLTETGAGSDALNAQTTASLTEDGKFYNLNGEKIFITNGAWADIYIVYAKVDGESFTGFIVERAFPGLSLGKEEDKMGIKGSSTTSVILKDCRVPKENVLFEIGQGHKIAFNVLNIGRYKLAASTVGACKIAITEAVKHANSREQFGRKISSFGMIKNKLADMSIRTFMAESLVYRLAGAIDDRFNTLDETAKQQGAENAKTIEEYASECSIAKIYGSECADFCIDELVQIFGGSGYIAEYPPERMYRDARINRIFEGTNEINRLLIPATILKRAMKGRLDLLNTVQVVGEEIRNYLSDTVIMGDAPLAAQERLVKISKKIFLLAAGKAANKLMATLAEEQEVMGFMADMIIEIYVMESGLLRAMKIISKKGESNAQYHAAAVKIYINDTFPKIVHWARQILAYVEAGDDLADQVATINRLADYPPTETIALRRLVAEKVIKARKYPF